jgi:gliding motility-associated-like protein
MRSFLILLYYLLLTSISSAQAPSVLQWQKTYGGTRAEFVVDFKQLRDGNFVMLGYGFSNDGDISGHHGSPDSSDVYIIKTDPAGNVIWQKSYGGTSSDDGTAIIPTSDGGLIFVASSSSNNGDVSGHHGIVGFSDVWVVKLDASGNIMWQKSYGGSVKDFGGDIIETAGGFIVTGETYSNNGDVSGFHGPPIYVDLWVFKIDLSGNLLWQRCYGGSLDESAAAIEKTLDGSFLLVSTTRSMDGDVSNVPRGADSWVIKISGSGNIIWDKCIGGNSGEQAYKIVINTDGTFFLVGVTFSTDLPGAFPKTPTAQLGDAWVVLLDGSGNVLWQKAFGGTDSDGISDAVKTTDGGYLLCGGSSSADGIVCPTHTRNETWLVKMDAAGNIQWNRTYGGNNYEHGEKEILMPSGDCYILSNSYSTDGDITNHKGNMDLWLSRYSFTGVLIYPAVTISANKINIGCAGETVQFIASPVKGGNNPSYQWQLNGVDIGENNDTILISNLYYNDEVSCVLTSNSNCVDVHTVRSNSLKITITLPPPGPILPKDTLLCSYQKIELSANKKFVSYLWSNGSTEERITVKQPGTYWLKAVDLQKCISKDSITIFPKHCIEGVFIPNAFTPNNDGRNDQFMPIMNADVKQYRFMVYDRWGRIVFETTTLNKGWDGTQKNMPYNTGVFMWQCIYQLEGEEPTSKRGTVLLLR